MSYSHDLVGHVLTKNIRERFTNGLRTCSWPTGRRLESAKKSGSENLISTCTMKLYLMFVIGNLKGVDKMPWRISGPRWVQNSRRSTRIGHNHMVLS